MDYAYYLIKAGYLYLLRCLIVGYLFLRKDLTLSILTSYIYSSYYYSSLCSI